MTSLPLDAVFVSQAIYASPSWAITNLAEPVFCLSTGGQLSHCVVQLVYFLISEETISAWTAKCRVESVRVEIAQSHGRDLDIVVVKLKN